VRSSDRLKGDIEGDVLEAGMLFWLMRSIAWVVLRVGFFIFGGIRFEGRENLPETGGVLITPIHISDYDPLAVGLALPRPCWIMAKAEIFTWWLLGPLARWLHGFPVKRGSPDRGALRRAIELLRQGEAVVIFPEGQTSKDGLLQPLHAGALFAARAADAPIVPTVLLGTDRLAPAGTRFPRFMKRPIVVRFGVPVTVNELTGGEKGGAGLRKGAERLGEILAAMKHAEYEKEAPLEPSATGPIKQLTPPMDR
jgi:1-acyl-sn-glycerol-3-phosphate acyltransferase